MVEVTRFNKETIIINADLIEMIEAAPDTVITMTTGKKFVVSETKEEMVDKIVKYKQRILSIISISEVK
ncbi:MAG TPA: flagellar FlbD family protein [Epulopiscium sp.]|nr:flagellar FlbD family protein [Candidatus Epulonipiscium sp.]